jgi:hypothetical protein
VFDVSGCLRLPVCLARHEINSIHQHQGYSYTSSRQTSLLPPSHRRYILPGADCSSTSSARPIVSLFPYRATQSMPPCPLNSGD